MTMNTLQRLLKWGVRGLFFGIFLVWAVHNVQPASVNWFAWATWQVPVAVLIASSLLLGFALGFVCVWVWMRKPSTAVSNQAAAPTSLNTHLIDF